jgi:hypothetical protein
MILPTGAAPLLGIELDVPVSNTIDIPIEALYRNRAGTSRH